MKHVPTLVRAADLAAYAPANHTGTSNVRVIGPETVGATALEVLVGTIVKSHGAKYHAHPHLEQCAYMMEGTGESQAQGGVEVMRPGTWTYIPAGIFHSFRVTSDQPGRLLVVYSPPYGENPEHTITDPDPEAQAAGRVHVLPPVGSAGMRVPLIDSNTVSARWVEIEAIQMAGGSQLSCAARPDAEQVLYLEHGRLDARSGGGGFHLAAGDFLFLPREAAADLHCPPGERAYGFLIRGRD